MFCGNCGAQLKENAKFCPKCGKPVKSVRPAQSAPQSSSHSENMVQRPYEKVGQTKTSDHVENIAFKNPEIGTVTSSPKSGKTSKRKNRKPLIIVLVVTLIILLGAVGVGGVMLLRHSENSFKQDENLSQNNTVEQSTEKQSDQSTAQTENEILEEASTNKETTATEITEAETTEAETTEEETTSEKIKLPYTGATTFTYPGSPADFTEISNVDGTYTFAYPKNMFEDGYYDPLTEGYYFATADKSVTLTIEKMESLYKNDTIKSANTMLMRKKSMFVYKTDTPYEVESKKVSESGYSRSIIGGQLVDDLSKAQYILHAVNATDTYVLTMTFPYGGTTGVTVEYSPCGYLLDCIYRGWSISGSTYKLRSYDQFMKDKMGEKKE